MICIPDPRLGPDPDPDRLWETPIAVHRPLHRRAPIVVASPHSGRAYPRAFQQESRLSDTVLRHSEDAHVDSLYADVLDMGIPMLRALFPRAMVDPNRAPLELDPSMFSDALPADAIVSGTRVAAGLGTIPRVVTNGEQIFDGRLRFADVGWRIEAFRTPYHAALQDLMAETVAIYGTVLVIDAHSMPSQSGLVMGRRSQADIVLGDRYGTSCHPEMVDLVESMFAKGGLTVARNVPYAGGYTTSHYGRPAEGVHVLQIEINRALYLNEATVEVTDGFAALQQSVGDVMRALVETFQPATTLPGQAAE